MKPDRFQLHVPNRHKINVYIWPTVEDLRVKIKALGYEDGDEALGFFHAPRTRVKLGRHNVVKRKVVAQIHLVVGHLGVDVVAHELQHFMSWWSVIKHYDLLGKDWERVAYLAQRINRDFWIQYFKRYTGENNHSSDR
jgi:hypothetical protein